ncbi:hypothetical protein [Pseudoalteromonas spongiae]|uniref:hypothetical protein n=1 Tax=Pseudoalteromonas spongiae TaxID=298657 RepID=UPI000C2D67FB|nr:hypothetical protein [Pseudoalteromonas spongiae]
MATRFSEWLLCPENQQESFRSPWVPYWVDRKKFELFWSKDTGGYIPAGEDSYLQAPYFGHLKGKSCFFIGRAYFDESKRKISFSGGRHRTRWYIDTYMPILIPLGLPEKSFAAGKKCGLIIREVEPNESINLRVSWQDIEEERKYYRS